MQPTERTPLLLGLTISIDRDCQLYGGNQQLELDAQPSSHHTHIYDAHTVQTPTRRPKRKETKKSGGNTCAWEDLPGELVDNVTKYLTLRDKVACASTCTRWRQICMGDAQFREKQRRRISEHLWMEQMRRHGRQLVEKKRELRQEQFQQDLLLEREQQGRSLIPVICFFSILLIALVVVSLYAEKYG